MSGVSKITAERSQRILLELVNLPGNDVCADCKARTPRWASYNIGVFICMNCASIHRKIGTHITKVKSLTLDSWSKEQVEKMKQVGNIKANAMYNPDERRHPPPANLIDSERDSELEKFIRAKYEYKSFMAVGASASMGSSVSLSAGPSVLSSSKSLDRSAAVAALLGPSRSATNRLSTRRDAEPPNASLYSSASSISTPPLPPRPTETPPLPPRPAQLASVPPVAAASALPSAPSVTMTQSFSTLSQQSQSVPPNRMTNTTQALSPARTIDATLPLQVMAQPTTQQMTAPAAVSTPFTTTNPYSNLSAVSMNPFPSMSQPTGISQGSIGRSMSLSTGLSGNMGTGVSPYQPSPLNPAPNPFAPQMLASANSMGSMSSAPTFMGGSLQPQTPFSQPQTPFGQPQTPFGQTPLGQPQTPFGQSQTPFGQSQTPFGQQQAPFGQPQTPFSAPASSPFAPAPVQQTQVFAPQPQMQMQPSVSNPYMQSQTPGTPFGMTPQYGLGGTPSPFAPTQPQVQAQPVQQMPQQGFGGANPFTSWIQQQPGQQGAGGYSWNGM